MDNIRDFRLFLRDISFILSKVPYLSNAIRMLLIFLYVFEYINNKKKRKNNAFYTNARGTFYKGY